MKTNIQAVKPLVKATFPDYTGRKFCVVPTDTITLHDTNWGGGTRNQYKAVRLEDGKVSEFAAPAPWLNGAEGTPITIPEGHVVVEHSIFCGKDIGLTFYGKTLCELGTGSSPELT